MSLLCFGEVIVDLLSDGQQPPSYSQFAGGAPANVAAAYSKLGGQSSFAGMLGQDFFSDFLIEALKKNGVDTKYCKRTPKAQTAITFIALDEHGERSFAPYRPSAADVLFKSHDFCLAAFQHHEMFHICSNSMIEQTIFQTTLSGLEQAKSANCLISFDINLRTQIWQAPKHIYSRIIKAVALSDIIKLTRNELAWLEEHAKPEHLEKGLVQTFLDLGAQIILLTNGPNPITCYTEGYEMVITPPKVVAIDTTAAGDAFMGGFLYAVHQQRKEDHPLDKEQLFEAVAFGSQCGALSVTRQGAFNSMPAREDLQLSHLES